MMTKTFKIALLGFVPPDNDGMPYRYLALECLTTSLERLHDEGIECRSWIVVPTWTGETVAQICDYEPDIIGISMPIGTFEIVRAFSAALMQRCDPLKVIIGNLSATLAPEIVLDAFPDAWVIRGEGERAFPAAVKHLASQADGFPHHVEGLCARERISPIINRESTFGSFDTSLWDTIFSEGGSALIEGSRGCVRNCAFCSTKRMHPCGWIGKSIDSIIDEIRALERYGVNRLFFVDDDFIGTSWERALELSDAIHRSFPEMTFGSSFRAESFLTDQQVSDLGILVDNGLRSMLIGAESFSDSQLRRFRKSSAEHNIRAIHNLETYPDIEIIIGFLIDPLITLEECRQSIGTLLEEGFTGYINDPFRPLDVHIGTTYERLASREGVLDQFVADEVKYTWHFLDERMEHVREGVERYRDDLLPYEKKVKMLYRKATRSAVAVNREQGRLYQARFNEIKRMKCEYIYQLTQDDAKAQEVFLAIHQLLAEEQ